MTISDIVNRIYFLTGTSGDTSASVKGSYPNADVLLAVNSALRNVSSKILMSDLRWRWDDSNQTDLPIATAALVTDQQDYSISTTQLLIERVEIKDESGNWHLLKPIDQSLLKDDREKAMTEYRETAGTPVEYDLVGESIFLYPKPDYSQAASLKIHFARGPVEYADSDIWTDYTLDGTQTPGFNTLFHDLIALWPAYEYCQQFHRERANWLFAEIQQMEKILIEFYTKRNNDVRPRFTISLDSNK